MSGKQVFKAGQFICGFLLVLSLSAKAQDKFPDVRLTVNFQEQSLANVLEAVSQQSGVSFSYNPRRIPINQKITYSAEQKSIQDIILDISNQANLTFEFIEGQIVLNPAKSNAGAKEEKPKFTLSGFIKDATMGKHLLELR